MQVHLLTLPFSEPEHMSTADDGGQLDPQGGLFVGGRVSKEQEIQLIISMTTPFAKRFLCFRHGYKKVKLKLSCYSGHNFNSLKVETVLQGIPDIDITE